MHRLRKFSLALLLSLTPYFNFSAFAEEIPIYTYHNLGPFITGEKQGLTYELATYLNQHAKGRWTFIVRSSPRMRFNKTISKAPKGIVPWVNPKWLIGLALEGDLWTSAYFKGANVVVSRQDNKIEYDGLASLSGYKILKVSGGVQKEIDDYIEQGNISLVEAASFEKIFKMLAHQRADFISVPLSMAYYMIPQLELEESLYVSGNMVEQYTRHFLVLNEHKELHGFLNNIAKHMIRDPIWIRSLKKFHMARLNNLEE